MHNTIYFDTIILFSGFHTQFYSISTQNSLSLMVQWFENTFFDKILVDNTPHNVEVASPWSTRCHHQITKKTLKDKRLLFQLYKMDPGMILI